MTQRSPITTHVLDISRGKAAAGVPVSLEKQAGSAWTPIKSSRTNADGRIEDLLSPGSKAESGIYRITFQTAEYFKAQGLQSFYPSTSIVFEIVNPQEHYHVPLLVSPYGYSTYRGT